MIFVAQLQAWGDVTQKDPEPEYPLNILQLILCASLIQSAPLMMCLNQSQTLICPLWRSTPHFVLVSTKMLSTKLGERVRMVFHGGRERDVQGRAGCLGKFFILF